MNEPDSDINISVSWLFFRVPGSDVVIMDFDDISCYNYSKMRYLNYKHGTLSPGTNRYCSNYYIQLPHTTKFRVRRGKLSTGVGSQSLMSKV